MARRRCNELPFPMPLRQVCCALAFVLAAMIAPPSSVHVFAGAVRVQSLSVDRMDALRDALLGGQPWLIGCLGQKGQDSNVNSLLEQAATTLSGKKYKKVADRPKIGRVNCKDKLPSGKSLKSRFKLRFNTGVPTFFFVGNGHDPEQLDIKHFTKKDKKDKKKLLLAPKVIANYALKEAVPTITKVDSDAAFKRHVLQRKHGSVLLLIGENGGRKGRKLTKAQQRIVMTIMRDHRNLRFFSLDLGKWEFQLPATVRHRVLAPPKEASDVGEGVEAQPPRVLFVDWGPNETVTGTGKKGKKSNQDSEKDKEANEDVKDPKPDPVIGSFRHLNERSKRWDAKKNSSPVSMSLCRHLIHDQMSRKEARRIFEERKVNLSQVTSGKRPESLFSHKDALYRINGRYYTWHTAAPFLATAALFDGTLSTDQLSRLDARAEHAEIKAAAKLSKQTKSSVKKSSKSSNYVHRISSPLSVLGGEGQVGKFSLSTMRKAVKKFLAKEYRVVDGLSNRESDDQNADSQLEFHPLKKGKRPKLVKFVSEEEREKRAKKSAARKKKALEEARKRKRKAAQKKLKESKEKKEKTEEMKKKRVERELKRRQEMDRMAEKNFVQYADEGDTQDEDGNEGVRNYAEADLGHFGDGEEDYQEDKSTEDEEIIDLDADEDNEEGDDEEIIDLDDSEEEEEEEEEEEIYGDDIYDSSNEDEDEDDGVNVVDLDDEDEDEDEEVGEDGIEVDEL